MILAFVLLGIFAAAGGLGLLLFPIELAAVITAATALALLRVLGLVSWHVVVVFADGTTRVERVRGLRAARRRASQLRHQVVSAMP